MINALINQTQLKSISIEQQALVKNWVNLYEGSGQAIDWIKKVRKESKRVNGEADNLIIKLRRARNLSKSLSHATMQPMTVGFFGLSQAGKSYLISSLAASSDTGKLATQLGEHQLDFINHINPPGGGKEATGLVTRFSSRHSDAPKDFPVELSVFNEIEIAKILANAFFNDFNQQKVRNEFDENYINQHLQALMKRKQNNIIPGVDSDDVVSLWDYMVRLAEKSQNQFKVHYWPIAIELAPYLTLADRAELFSLLWGALPELTEAYRDFAFAISNMAGAKKVFAPLSALVTEHAGVYSQKDSIMNVDMLSRLKTEDDFKINIVTADNVNQPISVSIAMLAALTVELYIPLSDKTSEPLFESVDLLDFPGYRGRLSLESMQQVANNDAQDESEDILSQLFLRGKVAYLFERYTDNQEMNTLIMCTASSKQSDVTSVGPVLDDWIKRTQGEDYIARSKRKAGLIWALTMFDMRVGQSLTLDESQLNDVWGTGGLMKMAMLERFGQYDWLQNWDGKPFNNTFLVRKPRLEQFSSIILDDNHEVSINPNHESKLALMRQTFVQDETINKHIASSAEAWDAMMTLNDGGMDRMTATLKETAILANKISRIKEQLEQIKHDLIDNRLMHWYQAQGAADFQLKQQVAREVVEGLNKQAKRHGEILVALLPEQKILERLYLQDANFATNLGGQTNESTQTGSSMLDDPFSSDNSFGDGIDLFSDAPVSFDEFASKEAINAHHDAAIADQDKLFTEALMSEWFAHLRQLPENTELLNVLGVPRNIMEKFIDELITAVVRLRVEQTLLEKFRGTEHIGVRRERLVSRQVFKALTHLGDFLSWLGYLDVAMEQRPKSRVVAGEEIFKLPEATYPVLPSIKESNQLLTLDNQPTRYTERYVYDWLVGLMKLIEENAGHSAGREIAAEDNERLGMIISLMRANTLN
ncbi:putative virulence factor [Thorsellia anophelis]|uniref:Virulence factor n=1 Tax=Thorsellia anophelis DSM 18579 TaxID=1123402 RepID=A0A1H9ZQY4_9GAMM|nr:virulence factor SrfC family protein [Thorsellia anophelis]SES84109.1 hypothetical protein SAMN02583745_00656 [Thorsellia anophelis DSM 18579]